MSEKEKQGKISEQAAQRAKSAIITLIEYTADREDQLHSLRLAVLAYLKLIINPSYMTKIDKELALSAGIEFNNGTWILKEGE